MAAQAAAAARAVKAAAEAAARALQEAAEAAAKAIADAAREVARQVEAAAKAIADAAAKAAAELFTFLETEGKRLDYMVVFPQTKVTLYGRCNYGAGFQSYTNTTNQPQRINIGRDVHSYKIERASQQWIVTQNATKRYKLGFAASDWNELGRLVVSDKTEKREIKVLEERIQNLNSYFEDLHVLFKTDQAAGLTIGDLTAFEKLTTETLEDAVEAKMEVHGIVDHINGEIDSAYSHITKYEKFTSNGVSLIVESADTNTETLTIDSHGLSDGAVVEYQSGNPRTGLVSGNDYHVIYVDKDKFKLAAASGGSALDIQDQASDGSEKLDEAIDVANQLKNFTFSPVPSGAASFDKKYQNLTLTTEANGKFQLRLGSNNSIKTNWISYDSNGAGLANSIKDELSRLPHFSDVKVEWDGPSTYRIEFDLIADEQVAPPDITKLQIVNAESSAVPSGHAAYQKQILNLQIPSGSNSGTFKLRLGNDDGQKTTDIPYRTHMAVDIKNKLNAINSANLVDAVNKLTNDRYEIVFSNPSPYLDLIQVVDGEATSGYAEYRSQILTFDENTAGSFRLRLGDDDSQKTEVITLGQSMANEIKNKLNDINSANLVDEVKLSNDRYEIIFTAPSPNLDLLQIVDSRAAAKPSGYLAYPVQTLTFNDSAGTFKLRLGDDDSQKTEVITLGPQMAGDIESKLNAINSANLGVTVNKKPDGDYKIDFSKPATNLDLIQVVNAAAPGNDQTEEKTELSGYVGSLKIKLNELKTALKDSDTPLGQWVNPATHAVKESIPFAASNNELVDLHDLITAIPSPADFAAINTFLKNKNRGWDDAHTLFDDIGFKQVISAYDRAYKTASEFSNYSKTDYKSFRNAYLGLEQFKTFIRYLGNNFNFEKLQTRIPCPL